MPSIRANAMFHMPRAISSCACPKNTLRVFSMSPPGPARYSIRRSLSICEVLRPCSHSSFTSSILRVPPYLGAVSSRLGYWLC